MREQRSVIMNEAVQRAQNFNAIEDLMLVNSGQKNKGEVFEKHKSEFKQIFDQLQPLEKKRAEINKTISDNIGQFAQISAQVSYDTSKADFFKKLDSSLNLYIELSSMMHQGGQFYQRLGEILNKLYQK